MFWCIPRVNTLHFSEWNWRSHLFDHSSSLLMSFRMIIASSKLEMRLWCRLRIKASWRPLIEAGHLYRWQKESVPIHCLEECLLWHVQDLMIYHWPLPIAKSLIQSNIFPEMPYALNFFSSRLWGNVSKLSQSQNRWYLSWYHLDISVIVWL